MSGDALGEIAAAPDSSPVRPQQWPRTMSGDALEDLAAAASAVTPEHGPQSESKPAGAEVAATPSPEPVRPMMWPRTMSGDTLELTLQTKEGIDCGAVVDGGYAQQAYSAGMMPPPPSQMAPVIQEFALPPPPGATPEDLYAM